MNSEIVVMPGASGACDVQAMASQSREDMFFSPGGIGGSDSGETVNATTAIGHGPVWQAVNILAGDVGQLPFHKMVRTGRNREKDRSHPIQRALQVEPNPWQTPSVWKETMMQYALLWGNAISVIVPRGRGRVWLLPLMPDSTSYKEVATGRFRITTRINNKEESFPYENCFHIRGLAGNGFWGISAVEAAKNVLGHGLALQKHGNRTFKNDAMPSGVLRTDSAFNQAAHQNLREEWYKTQGGDNRRSIAILWEGLEFKPMSMSNEDSQWLEARKLDREFVASLFNLPAFKLNALENSAVRANLEEQNRDYFQTSLSRWTNRFAEEALRKLLMPSEQVSGDHWFKWFPEAFLRGDIEKRYTSYSQGIASRILSPNEARAMEDMNPYDGGDEYINPAIETATSHEQQEKVSAMIREQANAIQEIEANRIERNGKTSKNFTAWADTFYQGFSEICQERLGLTCDLAASLGIECDWKTECEQYALESFQTLLDMTEAVTKTGLASAASQRAEAIRNNSTLADRILSNG